jgi:hypothetical protein
MCFLTLISIFSYAGYLIYEGYILTSLGILVGGLVFNLFTFYTNAYLIKGCQCAKINAVKKIS